jgi:hypothetical protein
VLQIRSQSLTDAEQFLLIDNVVDVKHTRVFYSVNSIAIRSDAGSDQIARGRAAAIMEHAIRDAGLARRVAEGGAPSSHWDFIAVRCRFSKPRDPFLTTFSKPFPPLD